MAISDLSLSTGLAFLVMCYQRKVRCQNPAKMVIEKNMILLSHRRPLMLCQVQKTGSAAKKMFPWLEGLEKAVMEGELTTEVAPEERWGNVKVRRVLQSQKGAPSSRYFAVRRKMKMIFLCFLFSQSICLLGRKDLSPSLKYFKL